MSGPPHVFQVRHPQPAGALTLLVNLLNPIHLSSVGLFTILFCFVCLLVLIRVLIERRPGEWAPITWRMVGGPLADTIMPLLFGFAAVGFLGAAFLAPTDSIAEFDFDLGMGALRSMIVVLALVEIVDVRRVHRTAATGLRSY